MLRTFAKANLPPDAETRTGRLWITAGLVLLYVMIAAPHVLRADQSAANLAIAAALAGALMALTLIDIRNMRLPDILTLPLIAAGLGLAGVSGIENLAWHAASAALGGLALVAIGELYLRVRGCHGLGLGDAKLFAAAGAWTGAEGLASVLLIGCATALTLVMIWTLEGRSIDRRTAIPFGPFLALGLWTVWLYGPLV